MNSRSTQHGPHVYDGNLERPGWQYGKVTPLAVPRPRINWLFVIALAAVFTAMVLWRFGL